MNQKDYFGIYCRACGQRPTNGIDPKTKRKWRQCGCSPYPASFKNGKGGRKITPADPTHRELAAIYGQPGIDDTPGEVEREIAERLAGGHKDRPEPIVGIECNGRVIPYTIDCFLPAPLSHTPRDEPDGRAEPHRLGRQAGLAVSAGVSRVKRNIGGC